MSFRIKEVFFDDRKIALSLDNDHLGSNYFTIVVGKNSTGKSRLLSSLVNTFETLSYGKSSLTQRIRGSFDRKRDKQLENFYVNYTFNDMNIYTLCVNKRKIDKSVDEVSSPRRILAVSASPYDKFPFERKDNNYYSYIGVRNNSNNRSGIAASLLLFENVIDLFTSSDINTSKSSAIINVFNFLNLKPSMSVTYKRNPYDFKKLAEALSITDDYDSFIRYINETIDDLYRANAIKANILIKLRTLIKNNDDYFKLDMAFSDFIESERANENNMIYNIDFNDFNPHRRDYSFLIYLLECRIIYISSISLVSNDYKQIHVEDLSSGEQCILSSMLGMILFIDDNSLICIDEPEISLHPEWQEKYIDLLFDTFKYFNGCHFIIATHSPQITSRVKNDNCAIVKMSDSSIMNAVDSFHKSADYQLAAIFNTPGYSNEYLNRIALNVFVRVGRSKKFEHEDIRKLEFLNVLIDKIRTKDPLYDLIIALQEMYKKYG